MKGTCCTCLDRGYVQEDREEEGVLVAWVVPCRCPAADVWVDELLGYADDRLAA